MKTALLFGIILITSLGFSQSQITHKHPIKRSNWGLKKAEVKQLKPSIKVMQSPQVGMNGPASINNNIANQKFSTLDNSRAQDSCGVDTLEYLQSKNTGFEWYYLADTTFNNGGNIHDYYSKYAQYYDAPGTVHVHGGCFYSYVFTVGDSALVTVQLYTANTDSTPDQLITEKDIWVYANYSPSNMDVMKQCVEFDSVITMNQPYLFAVSTATTEELLVLSNSFTNSDGANEHLGFSYYSNPAYPSFHAWYDQADFAANWDFDWILEPAVSYSHSISLSVDNDSICDNDTVCLEVDADLIIKHRMYNQDNPWYSNMVIDHGDGNISTGDSSNCHIYAIGATSNITIEASLSVNNWQGLSCTSSDQATIHVQALAVANFTTVDNLGGSITFTNTSSNADSIFWDLGNGITSTDQTFTYTFNPADSTYNVMLVAYGPCGNDTTVIAVSPTPLSINENELAASVSVFPNPSQGLFSVRIGLSGTYQYEVTDLNGRLISYGSFNNTSDFDLRNESNGVYFMKIYGNQISVTKRLVIAR